MQETELYHAIGKRLANSRDWPKWSGSSEFAKIRAQSEGARGSARATGKGERGR